MKIRDTAMGSWFRDQPREASIVYIRNALSKTHEGTFWDIIERYDLKAQTPLEISILVLDHLMDFDPDEATEEDI